VRPDYQSVILGSIPAGCEHAFDVGCGLGGLTRRLRTVVRHVVGIDQDQRSIDRARAHRDAGDITYLHGDFLSWPFPPESFDLVTATAALHHMDATAALRRMRDLLRPGGILAIVGLARGSSPIDLALSVPASIGARLHRLAGTRRTAEADADAEADGYRAPVCWPPPVTYRQMQRLAGQLLPGVRYRRRLYWRYSLTWAKPSPDR
jgi:SAM-dependent methyltransferase